MYILIARIAWCCDISQHLDSTGRSIPPPTYDYVAGFNVSATHRTAIGNDTD